jgi:hypothetical protein
MGGRLVPAVMNMVPEDKPGERTTMIYDKIDFGIDLKPSFFSLQTLKRKR